ncbi:hypothetical protein [Methylobacterium sp. 10]|uniref:hypothetical protein n=1 Tax=Methylobacterium sp. 10 TaxID=1101191 RepID=UPI0012DF5EAA|nr:hypothetical protein [Methylobacterium sp. 10]
MPDLDSMFDKSGPSYWSRRTDDELLSMQLTTDDPESVENLSTEYPPDDDAIVEMAYNVTGREKGKVQCAFCQYPNHFRGVVMRFRSGERRLVGRNCAQDHYGVAFEALTKDFDEARTRLDYVERQRLAVAQNVDLLGLLRAMKSDPAVKAFADTKTRLKTFIGSPLWDRLVRAADKDEMITGRMRSEIFQGRPIAYAVDGDTGPVRGADLIRTGPAVSQRLSEIEVELSTVMETLRGTEVQSRAIRAALVRMVDLLKQIEAERTRMRSVESFFDDGNLIRVGGWMSLNGRRNIRVAVLPFRLVDDYGQTECGPPQDYRIPGKALVAAMREAVVLQRKVTRRAS